MNDSIKSSASITILLMNYRRKDNIKIILDTLKSQTVSCNIFLWNNSGSKYHDDRIDLQIDASSNLKCWPRWSMVAYAKTEYIMTHDDDWCFTSDDCLRKLIDTHETYQKPGLAIGFNGVQLDKSGRYYPSEKQRKLKTVTGKHFGARHTKFPKKDTEVDIVKGRLIFCRREDLKAVPLYVGPEGDVADDIVISSYLAGRKKRQHIITSCLNNCIKELPGGNESVALSQAQGWEDYRTELSQAYFEKS